MERGRNYTIDLLRLFMSLFIVALHCNPFAEYNSLVSYIPSQVMSRFGVPFFSGVAGFYFFQNERTGKYSSTLLKYIEKYSIWSAIFLIYEFTTCRKGTQNSLLYILKTYLFTGYYHLWYMLAIIYTIILLGYLTKFPNVIKGLYKMSFILLAIGISMFGYGKLFFGFPIIQHTFGLLNQNINMQSQWLFLVIPFFMMGYGLHQRGACFSKIFEKCEILLPVVSVAYIMEVMTLQLFDLMNNTTLCLTTYPVVLLIMVFAQKYPYIGNEKIAHYCSGIASFIYFSHILFVLILQRLGFTETPTYLITVVSSGVLGLIIVKTNNSILKKLV